MNLFDKGTKLPGSKASGPHANMATVVMEMLQSSQGDGLYGLVQAFHRKGLGEIASSWVGTGQNLPVSPSQIETALGRENVQQLAAKAGMALESAGPALANLLPFIVDKLTPNGQLPGRSAKGPMTRGLLTGK